MFVINPRSLHGAKKHLVAAMKNQPEIKLVSKELHEKVASGAKLKDVFKMAADLYSLVRGNAAALISFDHLMLTTKVEASSPLEAVPLAFPSNSPNCLMGEALGQRLSVHVPAIGYLERRSLADIQKISAGQRAFGTERTEVETTNGEGKVEAANYPANIITSLVPVGFNKNGSLLLTPLGAERSTLFGFGFIWEYQATGPFSSEAIMLARTYAALFTYEIVKLAANAQKKA